MMFEFETTRPPYKCHVEVDMDWLKGTTHTKALPYVESSAYEPIEEPARVNRWAELGVTVKTAGLALLALSSVVFAGSLAIAERSGDESDIRRSSLSAAARALPVLAIGATAGSIIFSSKRN